MLKNHIKIAIRNFRQHKLTFIINAVGLSMGICIAILILLWVNDEVSTNTMIPDSDRIYQVLEHQEYDDQIYTFSSTPGLLARTMKEEFPEVEKASTITYEVDYLVGTNELDGVKKTGHYVEPDFVDILSLHILHGNRDQLLNDKASVIISGSMAEEIFGRINVVGDILLVNKTDEYVIKGVFEDLPEKVTYDFDFLLPYQRFYDENEWLSNWGNNGPRTLLKVREGFNKAEFNDKISDYIAKFNEGTNVTLFTASFVDLYLYNSYNNGKQDGGRIQYVRLFSLIGVFVLLIACINFMNLSTANSALRAKEVGVRKVIGSSRSHLIGQFLTESVLISLISLMLALLLAKLLIPAFNQITEKSLIIDYSNWTMLAAFLVIAIFTGIVAGSYPAFYLSGIGIPTVFRKRFNAGRGESFARRGLVVFQFVIALVLIVSTVIVYKQLDFILSKDVGYQKDNLILIPTETGTEQNNKTLMQAFRSGSMVKAVSASNYGLTGRNSNTMSVQWPGKGEQEILFEMIGVRESYFKTTGMDLIAGTGLDDYMTGDSIRSVVINQRAAEVMDISEDPVGKTFSFWGNTVTVNGVIRNFNFENMRSEVAPVIIYPNSPPDNDFVLVRLTGSDNTAALSFLEGQYKEVNPGFPFTFLYMEDRFSRMYSQESKVKELAKYFSIFTIVISCLGLFGLSAHVAQRKNKEIGIRKVLGASAAHIVSIVNREFVALVLISIILGSVIGYYATQYWLEDFVYRVEVSIFDFLMAAIGVLALALATVAFHSWKAALIDPVRTLKDE